MGEERLLAVLLDLCCFKVSVLGSERADEGAAGGGIICAEILPSMEPTQQTRRHGSVVFRPPSSYRRLAQYGTEAPPSLKFSGSRPDTLSACSSSRGTRTYTVSNQYHPRGRYPS